MMASTRLSAVLPLAIYLGRSFFTTHINRQIIIILSIFSILFIFFAPYIFWDTQQWIFFSRNPFMSQTSTGNPLILILMVIIIIYLSLKFKNIFQYCRYTSIFLFFFFIVSLTYNHLTYHADISFLTDADFDISYFTLALPYCLFSITEPLSYHRSRRFFVGQKQS